MTVGYIETSGPGLGAHLLLLVIGGVGGCLLHVLNSLGCKRGSLGFKLGFKVGGSGVQATMMVGAEPGPEERDERYEAWGPVLDLAEVL